MGASQGKSKKEQKEEARLWAETKDIELATLYGENTKLVNDTRLLQADFQTMKQTMEHQQRIIENMSNLLEALSRSFEEKQEEQQQNIIENLSKENAKNCERKSPRRVHFEDEDKGEQGVCCCPTTEAEHEAEFQRMFDEEWELVLSSHATISAQMRYMPGQKLDWAMLDEKGQQAATLLQQYGYPSNSIEQMRRQIFDVNTKFNKELFKFEGNHFRSVAKALFKLRVNFA